MAQLHAPKDAQVKGNTQRLVAIDCTCGDYAGLLVETRDMALELWERHVILASTPTAGAVDLGIIGAGERI